MSIVLHVEPSTVPLTREQFFAQSPENSIALDGYVYGAPWFDIKTKRANFNHHEEVMRLATRATCAQVLIVARQGLFATFPCRAKFPLHVYVNDCDEDVCLSVFLIRHDTLIKSASNPLLNKIVEIEDKLDTTAGAYPFPPDGEIAWVFDPYRRFRIGGGLERKNVDEFTGVITDVENRIMNYLVGKAGSVPIDTSYERLGGGSGWALIKETGNYSKAGVFGDGNEAYVSVRERPHGGYTYAIGKVAFFRLDIPKLIIMLNELEKTTGSGDEWGGGETVMGSPRVRGSFLRPDQVTSCVNECLTL